MILCAEWKNALRDKFATAEDHSKEAVSQLVVAGGDVAIYLEVAEHALDAVALLVERPVMLDFYATV